MIETIPILDVVRLLTDSGHTFALENQNDEQFGILHPPVSIYMTVGLVADSTLYPSYRDRYFLCQANPEAMFSFGGVPSDLASTWSKMLDPVSRDWSWQIVGALAAWTMGQLHQSERIFVWPEKPVGLYEDYLPQCYAGLESSLGTNLGSEVWPEMIGNPRPERGFVLNPQDELFPILMAALFLFASREFEQFNFAADDGKRVFVMHHHDKIVISIPDESIRSQLLEDLRSNPLIFFEAPNIRTSNDHEWDFPEVD